MVDYFSFEDVMRELELSEEDLKRMVSEGELRAFRDENKMKFKKDDVEHLKKGRITEPTIILPSTPGGGQDETVLDLDITHEAAQLQSGEPRVKGPPPPPPAGVTPLDAPAPSSEEHARRSRGATRRRRSEEAAGIEADHSGPAGPSAAHALRAGAGDSPGDLERLGIRGDVNGMRRELPSSA